MTIRPNDRSSHAADGFVFECLEERQLLAIQVNSALPDASTTRGATPSLVSLFNRYTESWITSMVRFATNSGNLDIALFGGAAPNTVANFLNYVTQGRYNNTIFHREQEAATNGIGILQGGGFTVPISNYTTFPAATPGQAPQPVVTNPSINLEHPTGNRRGTIAMARTNAINSANSQFFFNTVDNTNLDDPTPGTPDAGYAVFGQLTSASLAVLDALAAYHNSDMGPDYDAASAGADGSFGNLPLRKEPVAHQDGTYVDPPIAPSDFLQIYTATTLNETPDAVLNNFYSSIQVTSSDPNIATASISGGSLVLTPSATNLGNTTITVTMTSLDGTVTTDEFVFTVANAAPLIGGVQGQSNVPVGGTMLVSAFGVRDGDVTGGSVSSVSFYHDTNGDGQFDGGDALLGSDNAAAGGWNARVSTAGLTPGANTIFARVTDADGLTATASRTVVLRPQVPTGGITPGGVTVSPGQNVDLDIGGLPNASGIRRLSIFVDSNNDGLLNPLTDRLIGHATYSAGSNSWVFTVSGEELSAGLNRIFARVTDNYGNLGALASSTITVS